MTATLELDREAIFADLGYEPHAGQLEVHRSRAPRRVLACGVRWGKTLCAAMEGLAAALEPKERSMGWVVSGTYELADKVFREIAILAAEHLNHRVVELKSNDRKLVLRNLGGGLSEIRAKSADNPISLLGEGLDWVIVDEAAQLKPAIWQSFLSQRLVDKKGWALLISTPKGKGWFFGVFRRGQEPKDPDHASWNSPSWRNPYLDRSLIEAERERLPERVFQQEYGGQFVEGSGAVFRHVREAASGEWQDPKPGREYVAGLDLAKVEDYTVLVVMEREERRVVFADRFHRLDWSVQTRRIRAAVERYNGCLVYADVTGVGDPVCETLSREGIRIEPYPFTARSKAALVDNLAILLERRQITLPRADLWPEGIDELEAFTYSVTDSGNVRSSAPSGTHDDIVMALALAAWPLRDGEDDLEIFFI